MFDQRTLYIGVGRGRKTIRGNPVTQELKAVTAEPLELLVLQKKREEMFNGIQKESFTGKGHCQKQ